jgi:hypothetical protein
MTIKATAQTVTTLALLVSSASLSAQSYPTTASPRSGWLARATSDFTGLSSADRAVIEANLGFAEALVARISGYAKPRGFEVHPSWLYDAPRSHDRLSQYQLVIWNYVPTHAADHDGVGGVGIWFNPELATISEPTLIREESGERIYIERVRSTRVHGATVAYGTFGEPNTEGLFVLFTSGDQSPMLPVTREEYLRTTIFSLEGKDQEKLKQARAGFSRTPYERWIEDAAERKKTREAVIATIPDQAQAAKTRAEMAKGDREMEEALKKDEPKYRAMVSEVTKSSTTPGDKIRAEIAAMTPAERASPAWVHGTKLVPAGTPDAKAVVRTNPAFYRARRSPVEPRAVFVHLSNLPDVVMGAQRQLNNEFDWAALKRLLDQRP